MPILKLVALNFPCNLIWPFGLQCNENYLQFWQYIIQVPFGHHLLISIYSSLSRISCNMGLYFFKYLPFILKIRPSKPISSISYALLEKTLKMLKGPSQFGDH